MSGNTEKGSKTEKNYLLWQFIFWLPEIVKRPVTRLYNDTYKIGLFKARFKTCLRYQPLPFINAYAYRFFN